MNKRDTMYQCQISATEDQGNGFTCTRSITTYFLSAQVCGIIDAQHAADIARRMFERGPGNVTCTVTVSAYPVTIEDTANPHNYHSDTLVG